MPMKNKSQSMFFVIMLLIALLIGFQLARTGRLLALNWFFGIALGVVIHRSRFCFAGAFRDFFLFRDAALTRAMILVLATTTLGFAAIQFHAYLQGAPIPGKLYPAGLNTAAGAVLFGVGMVITGGCACSSLARLGEGFLLYTITFTGLLIGSLVGVFHYSFWKPILVEADPIFLPALLGWPAALTVQFALFGLIYYLVQSYEQQTISLFRRGSKCRNSFWMF